ncbi:DDE superfamily endonuclease domain-containing protein [Ditylenchus destructor]|nr:DDE superfamily endonuclease domain-containing protein [Ditylenchus destructor]
MASNQSFIEIFNGKLLELRRAANEKEDFHLIQKVEALLSRKLDQEEEMDYYGLHVDSDANEESSDDSDESNASADEAKSRTFLSRLDPERMGEIVFLRDFHEWSLDTIRHQKCTFLATNDATARKQISRMRKCLKKGGFITSVQHKKIRENVWNDVKQMDDNKEEIHDFTIQEIAMIHASKLKLDNFNASSGWLHYFKKEFNIVDRHIDKTCTVKSIVEKQNLDAVYNADQTAVRLEPTSGRTLTIKGAKKVMRQIQRQSATTHSYTAHVTLRADGILPQKLPVVLYEPAGAPQKWDDEVSEFENLRCFWTKSGWMNAKIAKDWLLRDFLPEIEVDCVLVLDAWKGFKQGIDALKGNEKNLKIITLPPGSTSVLQPADEFIISIRRNLLTLMDLVYNQLKAPRYLNMIKYAWYKAGYLEEHPGQFETPTKYCFRYKGVHKCQMNCDELCFIRCSHCEYFHCFQHILNHRH